jgi:hypothetical protein
MDFELTVWQVLRREFPETKLRGCVFHWTQSVWRKVQKLGLQSSYSKDPATNSYVRKILALPMLPSEHIVPVFEKIGEDAVTEPLQQLVAYVPAQWIDNQNFLPSTWTAFYQSVRTNNDLEGWHGRLNRKASKAKLPLYLLIQLLGEEAQCMDAQCQLVTEGELTRYQRRIYKQIQGKLFDFWEEYLLNTRTVNEAKRLLSKVSGVYLP